MKRELAVIGLRGFPGVQGGVERHCAVIIPGLGLGNTVVYRRKAYLTSGSNITPTAGISFCDLPSTRIKGFEAAFHTFLCACHLLFNPAKVVNVHNIGPALFIPLLKIRGAKVVTTYHSANYLHSKWGPLAKMALRLGEKIAFRFSDKVIFVSKSMMDKQIGSLGSKAVFIPNPVTPATPTTATDLLQPLGIVPGSYILSVGRITPEKGLDTLIRAAASLPPHIKVVIAGTYDNGSAYMTELRSLDNSNRVIFTGFADSGLLAQLYSHAAAFVLPSLHEGLSLSLLEAMTYSLPIIASDIPANRLPQLSGLARFFNPASTDSLARALNELPHGHIEYNLSDYSLNTVISKTKLVHAQLLSACR